MKLFSGSSNPQLAQEIADILGILLGKITIRQFSDGEIWVKYEENIRNEDVFILQSTNPPADNIIELMLMLDAARRASAHNVTAVIPYFGYGRQDRKDRPRVPISARLFMDTFETVGANRIVTMDLHSPQIQGFVNIPFDHLYSRLVLVERLKKMNLNLDNGVLLSPDIGSARMGQSYARYLDIGFAVIDKRRPEPNRSEVVYMIGDLKDRHVLILDDMIDTAGTIVSAAHEAHQHGALSVTVVATHALLSGQAVQQLKQAPVDKIIVTNTVPVEAEELGARLEVVSVADVFARSIQRINEGQSLSLLFKEQ